MDFDLNDTQRMIQQAARDYATRTLVPRASARDRASTFPASELGDLAKLGLLGVNIPEALGGAEAGALAYSLAMEEISRADASVSVAMAVTNMVAEVVTTFGTDAQKRQHVPRLVGGEYVAGAFALSEPQAGSDPGAMATVARKDGAGFVLSGQKQWITSGDRAGLLVVWAKTDTAAGTRGISAFLVEGGTKGLSAGKPEDKMGLRGSTTVPLLLEDVRVGPEALLGREGEGFKIAMMALDGGRIGIGSQACGIAGAALDCAVRYSRDRKQFDHPIGDFQAIQFMLADMATELEASRLLVRRAALRKERRQPFSTEAAMAKLYASERANRICDRAVQIHGGYGYTREFPVERFLRDVRVTTIYEGTSQVQRIVISRAVAGP